MVIANNDYYHHYLYYYYYYNYDYHYYSLGRAKKGCWREEGWWLLRAWHVHSLEARPRSVIGLENSSVRLGSVRKFNFPVRRGSTCAFRLRRGSVRFGSVRFRVRFRPVPVWRGSVRFGSVRPVRFGLLLLTDVLEAGRSVSGAAGEGAVAAAEKARCRASLRVASRSCMV